MNLEAKKLNLIERFMKFNQERSILQIEAAITEIEINSRAELSEQDIEQHKVRSYDDFSNEIKGWIQSKSTK
jgi:hypothetical protein